MLQYGLFTVHIWLVNPTLRERGEHMVGDGGAAGGLAEEGHSVWVSAEGADVLSTRVYAS